MPEYGLVHLLDLQEEQLEIIEMLLGKDSRVTGRRVGDLAMPEGSLLISVLREGKGFVPGPDTVLEAGDEVLAVLDPGREDDLKDALRPGGRRQRGRLTRGRPARSTSCWSAAGWPRPTAPRSCAGAAPRARSCSPAASRSRPTNGRRSPRSTCAAMRSARTPSSTPPSWYEENGVELLTGVNVMSLDPAARTAKLQGGEEMAFDKALLATGAMVNILRVEGAENEGIHYLRAFGNSDAIRADAEAAERVVLVGGSYIASEVAASLTAKGVSCTIVMIEDVAALADLRRGRRALVPGAARGARRRRSTAARSWRRSRATAGSGPC